MKLPKSVEVTLDLKESIQSWADEHFQAHLLDCEEGPVDQKVHYLRTRKVAPLSAERIKNHNPPKNWEAAWQKKWGWCLPKGIAVPKFKDSLEAEAFWAHHLNEHGKEKEFKRRLREQREKIQQTDHLELTLTMPWLFRWKPKRFELPNDQIAAYWSERVDEYLNKKCNKYQLRVWLSCYDVLEAERIYLNVHRTRFTSKN